MKKLAKNATIIQSMVRCVQIRRIFQIKKRAASKLSQFTIIVLAVKTARIRRDVAVAREFVPWRPLEEERRATRLNDTERRRLIRQQQVVQEGEMKAVVEIKQHILTRNGRVQVSDMASRIAAGTLVVDPSIVSNQRLSSGDAVRDMAEQELLRQAKAHARLKDRHDFNAKMPPFVRCADPVCNAIFTSGKQYLNHLKFSDYHLSRANIPPSCHDLSSFPLYSELHMQLKGPRAQDLMRAYLARRLGIDPVVNCLDAWIAIQDWRKVVTKSEHYTSKALSIYETFLSDDCERPLQLRSRCSEVELKEICRRLEVVKNREGRGLLTVVHASRSKIRQLLGMSGQQYQSWVSEREVSPDIFDKVEWLCFLNIFETLERDPDYHSSTEWFTLQVAHDADEALRAKELESDFRRARMAEFRNWVGEFKAEENAMSQWAILAADSVLKDEVDRIADALIDAGLKEKVFEIQHEEQRVHEHRKALLDEALSWVSMNVEEEIYERYVSALIMSMLEVPECRKGMLEYSGLLKKNIKKRLLIDMNVKSASKAEWFEQFTKEAIAEERKVLPMDAASATVVIQRRLRGVLGRKKARRIFVATYSKRYDSSSGQCYYVNNQTGETSWQKPLITAKLISNTSW